MKQEAESTIYINVQQVCAMLKAERRLQVAVDHAISTIFYAGEIGFPGAAVGHASTSKEGLSTPSMSA
jgi:hypothetical protein